MEEFGVFIIRDLEGTNQGVRRLHLHPMSSSSKSHSQGDPPTQNAPSLGKRSPLPSPPTVPPCP